MDEKSARTHSSSNETLVDARTAFAVEFVVEVEDRAVADLIRAPIPDPETPGVVAESHRSYVDTAGLAYPTVGGSVAFLDRRAADALYETVSARLAVEDRIRAGTLAVRRRVAGPPPDADFATVTVTMTRYP